MVDNLKMRSLDNAIVTLLVLINAIILSEALINGEGFYWALTLSIPLLVFAIFKVKQKKQALNVR